MDTMEKGVVMDGRHPNAKRRRTLISCTECHRRKQKCDRRQPCQNCVKRGKLELCRYERNDNRTYDTMAANATSVSSGESSNKSSTLCADPPSLPEANQLSTHDYRNLVSTLGYSAHNVHSTLGLVNKVGATNSFKSSPLEPTTIFNRKHAVLDDKYRSLVRQLPSKEHIDILVQQFFSEINWQYDVLDEITFHQQLDSWRCLPYSAHSQEINSLSTEILTIPSLVFQLMAHALIHQSIEERTSLESLKYASGMTFIDLAREFSEAGYSLIGSLEQKDISMVAIQSGILRASFLKNTGNVIEAWHVVGTTIRNAQEIGLHASIATEIRSVSVDAQWDLEMRHRVWFVLHNWDIHMAVVLGRPITTSMAGEPVNLPNDLARREIGQLPRRRKDQDAPTPTSVIRIGYDVAYQYFLRVRKLENHGAPTDDYHIVRETHAAIVENMERMPRWCRHNDPDVYFDGIPNCRWLPAARQAVTSGIYFVLLSLHRPYIFSVSESRAEALKAALMVFTTQRQLFLLSEPKNHLTFNMVYPLFDAMIISLAILVLFPTENRDVHSQLIENIYWGIEMLAKIGQDNAMARSANGVVRTLLSRLMESPTRSRQYLEPNGEEAAMEHLGSGKTGTHALGTSMITGFTTDNLGSSSPAASSLLLNHQARPTASTAFDIDVETLLPPHPVGDLFYQEVHTSVPEALPGAELPTEIFQFNSNHSEDSFWSFMNDLSHA